MSSCCFVCAIYAVALCSKTFSDKCWPTNLLNTPSVPLRHRTSSSSRLAVQLKKSALVLPYFADLQRSQRIFPLQIFKCVQLMQQCRLMSLFLGQWFVKMTGRHGRLHSFSNRDVNKLKLNINFSAQTSPSLHWTSEAKKQQPKNDPTINYRHLTFWAVQFSDFWAAAFYKQLLQRMRRPDDSNPEWVQKHAEDNEVQWATSVPCRASTKPCSLGLAGRTTWRHNDVTLWVKTQWAACAHTHANMSTRMHTQECICTDTYGYTDTLTYLHTCTRVRTVAPIHVSIFICLLAWGAGGLLLVCSFCKL